MFVFLSVYNYCKKGRDLLFVITNVAVAKIRFITREPITIKYLCYQEVTASIMAICNEELLIRNYGEVYDPSRITECN